jgi:hypothetical protein
MSNTAFSGQGGALPAASPPETTIVRLKADPAAGHVNSEALAAVDIRSEAAVAAEATTGPAKAASEPARAAHGAPAAIPVARPRQAVTPSRRGLLALLAASPMVGAAALPALAAAHDPIFAAIANWRSAKSAWLTTLDIHSRIDEQVDSARGAFTRRFEIGTCDHVENGAIVHVDRRFASTVEELDRHVASAKREPMVIKVDGSEVCSRITMKPGIDIAEVRATLAEAEGKIEAEKERLGLDAADDRAGAALGAYQDAVNAVYETVPRSREGLLALIGVFQEDHEGMMPEEDTVETVLASIAASVKGGLANV